MDHGEILMNATCEDIRLCLSSALTITTIILILIVIIIIIINNINIT